MARTNISGSRTKVLEIPRFNGLNTASSFSEIDITQSPRMLNLLPGKQGSLTKRPGIRPMTFTPLPNPIKRVGILRFKGTYKIIGVSDNKIYQIYNGGFIEQTHEVPLLTSDVDFAQFKGENGQELLVIADGGDLKAYDSNKVFKIAPAPNDESPLPANDLENINTKHKPTGCLVHNTRVVLWNGSDTIWHSKIGFYDYFPKTDYHRFVRENDYVQTCVTYRGSLLVFMRRHIGVLFGHDIENWRQDFLDTTDGCIAPKTVRNVTFPDGRQEVFYLSDNGVNAVYAIDTLSLDSSARYSTKNVSSKYIDWASLGISTEELEKAVGYFHQGKYWLLYKKGVENKGLVFDTDTGQWYPIDNIQANDFYSTSANLHCVNDVGHLMFFDSTISSDFEDYQRTIKHPINAYWHSKMITPKVTGYDHFWDVLIVEAKQFSVQSSLDVEVNTQQQQNFSMPSGVNTSILVWGVTNWGSEWANPNLTDYVNNPKRLRTFLKGRYAQIKLSNNRDEPVEIYNIRYEVRTMDTYY